MEQSCDFCGNNFIRSDRALLSERFCPCCITDRLKKSGATFFDQEYISLKFNESGYVVIDRSN